TSFSGDGTGSYDELGDEDEGYEDDDYLEEDDDEESTEESGGEPVCNDVDEVVLYLSPDDSNSMSSPVQVRQRVLNEQWNSLNGLPIRVWEFMNYYSFPYPAAEHGELALHAAIEPVEGEPDTWRLQLAVSSETMVPEQRPPINVTLVLDTSGSMAGRPIELLEQTCLAIASQLREGDTVSVVEWDTENVWTLGGYPVTGPNDSTLIDVIDSLEA